MVSHDDLNNMDLVAKEMVPRIPEKMQQVISVDHSKDFSVHNIKNFFWKFP